MRDQNVERNFHVYVETAKNLKSCTGGEKAQDPGGKVFSERRW